MSNTEGLSETELAARCSWSMLDRIYTEEQGEQHEAQRESNSAMSTAAWKQGAKIIAGIEDNKEIRIKLIHKLMRDGTDQAIRRYLRKELIPQQYVTVVQSDQCLQVLVQGFFYKVCKVKQTVQLDIDIKELCKRVKLNAERALAYDRVGQIQKFIHTQVDELFGENFHIKISTKHMRNLLGAARLHLHLCDTNERDDDYAVYMDELSRIASRLEYVNPRPANLPPGRRFIPTWRVRHLKPLTNYYSQSARSAISSISELNLDLPHEEYMLAALRIFSLGARY